LTTHYFLSSLAVKINKTSNFQVATPRSSAKQHAFFFATFMRTLVYSGIFSTQFPTPLNKKLLEYSVKSLAVNYCISVTRNFSSGS